MDLLRNATYDISPVSNTPSSVTLVNGNYESGTDAAAPGYLAVFLGEKVAFGDLNFDGRLDAAVTLAVNTGGTGVFMYLVPVLDDNGAAQQATMVYIDDRAMINSLEIASGEIRLDGVVHAEADAMCCPTMQVQKGYRLYGNQLVLTRLVSWASGSERAINIETPSPLAEMTYPFTVTGSVTIGPFENTLHYALFTQDNELVNEGAVMTDSPDMGAPGNFSLPVDLSMAGVYGLVRIEFSELSMKDGSVLTLGSVVVNVN